MVSPAGDAGTIAQSTGMDADKIFYDQPEWVDTDLRKDRQERFQVTAGFLTQRHRALLPRAVVEGRTVLDIGCCVASTGAWCLGHGASHYVGIENNSELCELARRNLQQYHSLGSWQIINCSVEHYLEHRSDQRFDLVYCGGVIHAGYDWITQLQALSEIAHTVIVEGIHPDITVGVDDTQGSLSSLLDTHPEIRDRLAYQAPFMCIREVQMFNGDRNSLLSYGCLPSMGALKHHMERLGFAWDDQCDRELQVHIPQWFHPRGRFGIRFYRAGDRDTDYLTVRELYDRPQKRQQRLKPWKLPS